MRTPKLVTVGYIIGFMLIGLGFFRYMVIYEDYGRALQYFLFGILTMCVSWSYSRIKHLYNKLDAVEDYLQDRK